ncbi:hypothetical protein G7074_15680 [Pedobacter sp. HDW13]|uniref:hypothetical protein n=1 Tax=unclassified Pedobacter TaxID=2628915 RepID=UPI000F5B536E|nr:MULTISPECIES: hypothetical protein [unclassified Pedobacter]QIL40578.1 hypothetical protein G7074_15680 [Pedobacter sp. HDW13]RQO66866.1 hypothetical protein DBR40_21680 [Pedobacter sp. KBW01]
MNLKRALSGAEVKTMKFKTMDFTGGWLDLLGKPEPAGCWLVWGNSFNGKTRFVLTLCKYLTAFGKVAYDSLEEGFCKDMQDALSDVGMEDVKNRFQFLGKESIPDLTTRLEKPKSAAIVVIDSLQYSDLNLRSYKELRSKFPKKLFIIISHADGKEPEGRVAKKIKYDAAKKIRIEGYRAFSQVRGKGSAHYDIWPAEAARYWNELT